MRSPVSDYILRYFLHELVVYAVAWPILVALSGVNWRTAFFCALTVIIFHALALIENTRRRERKALRHIDEVLDILDQCEEYIHEDNPRSRSRVDSYLYDARAILKSQWRNP